MVKVFLSYSRKDYQHRDRLINELNGAGLNVWTDEGLEPGTESWQAEIEKEIEECNFMTVLLSPAAKKSKWVRREVAYGASLGKKIYPVLIAGDEKNAIPLELVGMQHIDIRTDYESNIRQFLSYLSKYISEEELLLKEIRSRLNDAAIKPVSEKGPSLKGLKSDTSPFSILQQAIGKFRTGIFSEEGTGISRLSSIIEEGEAYEEAKQLDFLKTKLLAFLGVQLANGIVELREKEKSRLASTSPPDPTPMIRAKKQLDFIEISVSRDLLTCHVWDKRYPGREDNEAAARLFEMGYLKDISRPRNIIFVDYEISKQYSRKSKAESNIVEIFLTKL